jgi:hypothetical protein
VQPVQRLAAQAGAGGAANLVEEALKIAPDDPCFLIAHAESAMRAGAYDEAVRRWQTVAEILGEEMPQAYYRRLQDAYEKLRSFPRATPEQEVLRGDLDKYEVLAAIHRDLAPRFYLEIGVQHGKSLALAHCRALGVDPMPQLTHKLGAEVEVLSVTSDEFFAGEAGERLAQAPDLVFIDGMHLFEFVLRDFINVERYAEPWTLVAIDDVFPGHPAQAQRARRTRAWTGDVWKLLAALSELRPDLFLLPLDAHPTGLLLVAALDRTNDVLHERYRAVVDKYAAVDYVPPELIARTGAVSSTDPRVSRILAEIREARQSKAGRAGLAARLTRISASNAPVGA